MVEAFSCSKQPLCCRMAWLSNKNTGQTLSSHGAMVAIRTAAPPLPFTLTRRLGMVSTVVCLRTIRLSRKQSKSSMGAGVFGAVYTVDLADWCDGRRLGRRCRLVKVVHRKSPPHAVGIGRQNLFRVFNGFFFQRQIEPLVGWEIYERLLVLENHGSRVISAGLKRTCKTVMRDLIHSKPVEIRRPAAAGEHAPCERQEPEAGFQLRR